MEIFNFINTPKIKGVINSNFYLSHHERKDKTHKVLLTLTYAKKRKRIPLDIFVKKSDWNSKKQRLKPNAENAKEYNLILSKADAKITDIKIFYQLSGTFLSIEKLAEEFQMQSPSFDFIGFMIYQINNSTIKASTKKTQLSRANRLRNWKETIPFSSITNRLLDDYRRFLHKDGLSRNSINSHFKTIMKYIRLAKKYGMTLNIDMDRVEVRNIRSNRVALTPEELERLWNYWDSTFCAPRHRLPVGYFLFVCKTGLRLAEWKSLKREDFNKDHFVFYNQKSDKYIRVMLNNSVKRLLRDEPELFVTYKSDQKMRDYLKEACRIVGIKKRVDFHTGRHTFATHFAQRGGKVVDLQNLLGHSDIKTTMIYYHPNNTGNIDTTILD